MLLGVKHFTEPTTRGERSATKEEQEQWRAADKRIAELERELGEMILALEYERDRTRQPSVSGGTALVRARSVLGI